MKLKKILVFMLAAVLMLALVACGGNSSSSESTTDPTPAPDPVSDSEPEAAPPDAQEEEAAEEQAEAPVEEGGSYTYPCGVTVSFDLPEDWSAEPVDDPSYFKLESGKNKITIMVKTLEEMGVAHRHHEDDPPVDNKTIGGIDMTGSFSSGAPFNDDGHFYLGVFAEDYSVNISVRNIDFIESDESTAILNKIHFTVS